VSWDDPGFIIDKHKNLLLCFNIAVNTTPAVNIDIGVPSGGIRIAHMDDVVLHEVNFCIPVGMCMVHMKGHNRLVPVVKGDIL